MPGDSEGTLVERIRRAGASWDGIVVDDAALQSHVLMWAGLRSREAGEPADPAELFIAIACILDVRGAVQAFEKRYVDSAMSALRSYRLSPDEADEARQRMRVALFVDRRDDAPVLLQCAGYGRLGGLVRVVLVRAAMRLRSNKPLPDLPVELLADGADTHGLLADDEHQVLLKAAFAHATAALDLRARTVLRLHYLRGVSGSQIGRMHGVHRGTAARWLASARNDLLREVHRYLLAEAPELEQWPAAKLRELVHSRLELSLSRILAD